MSRLIGIGEVARLTGRSRSTIRRYLASTESDFPTPVELGPRDHGWHEHEVTAWIEARPRVRTQSAANAGMAGGWRAPGESFANRECEKPEQPAAEESESSATITASTDDLVVADE